MSTEVAVHDTAEGASPAALQLAAPSSHVIAALVLTAMCGGTVKGIAGFGAAIVNLLIWLLLTVCGVDAGPMQQLVLLNLLALLTDSVPLVFITRPWKNADARIVLSLAGGSVVGLPLGIWLLVYLPISIVQLATAGALLLLLAMQTAQPLCRVIKDRYGRPHCKALPPLEVAVDGGKAPFDSTDDHLSPCCSHAAPCDTATAAQAPVLVVMKAAKSGSHATAESAAAHTDKAKPASAFSLLAPPPAAATQPPQHSMSSAEMETEVKNTAITVAVNVHEQSTSTLVAGEESSGGARGGHHTSHPAAQLPPSYTEQENPVHRPVHAVASHDASTGGGLAYGGQLTSHPAAPPPAASATAATAAVDLDLRQTSRETSVQQASSTAQTASTPNIPRQAACLDRGDSQLLPRSDAAAARGVADYDRRAHLSVSSNTPATEFDRPSNSSSRSLSNSGHGEGSSGGALGGHHTSHPAAPLPPSQSQAVVLATAAGLPSQHIAVAAETEHVAGVAETEIDLDTQPLLGHSHQRTPSNGGGAALGDHHTSHPAPPPPPSLHAQLDLLHPADLHLADASKAQLAAAAAAGLPSLRLLSADLEGQPLLGSKKGAQQSSSAGPGCKLEDGKLHQQKGMKGRFARLRALAWRLLLEQRARWFSREGLILVSASTLSGFCSGVLNGLTALGGPAMIALYLYLKLPPINVRANGACGPIFIAPIAITNFVRYGLLHASAWKVYLGFVCGSASGVGIGCLLVRFLNVRSFAHVMRVLMLMCCMLLFASGLGWLPTHHKT